MGTARSLKYFGANVTDDGSKPQVLSGTAQATATTTKPKTLERLQYVSR